MNSWLVRETTRLAPRRIPVRRAAAEPTGFVLLPRCRARLVMMATSVRVTMCATRAAPAWAIGIPVCVPVKMMRTVLEQPVNARSACATTVNANHRMPTTAVLVMMAIRVRPTRPVRAALVTARRAAPSRVPRRGIRARIRSVILPAVV